MSRRVALAATLVMGIYLVIRLPADRTSRIYAAVAVAVTYLIVRRITTRLAMEFLPQ